MPSTIKLRAPALDKLVEVLGLQQFIQTLIETMPRSRRQLRVRDPDVLLLLPLLARPHRIRRFYKPSLWIPQHFLLTNLDLHHGLLENSFEKGGVVLQEIVNELGRRLDFDVEDGLYQGKKTVVGFDGLWRSGGDPDILVEVKTTDYVAVSLDKIATYKERLYAEHRIEPNASMLLVVGREDTGALEAQVRGSRYAWDMRLISMERMIKLVQIKEKSDDPTTLSQIRQLLRPFEYTKIDRIIDVIFTTAVDVEEQQFCAFLHGSRRRLHGAGQW